MGRGARAADSNSARGRGRRLGGGRPTKYVSSAPRAGAGPFEGDCNSCGPRRFKREPQVQLADGNDCPEGGPLSRRRTLGSFDS
jgi:hypothetical protein